VTFFLGLNPIAILLGGGALGMLVRRATALRSSGTLPLPLALGWRQSSLRAADKAWVGRLRPFGALAVSVAAVPVAVRPSLGRITLFFLKVGAVLYGGGYVLLAFLEQGLTRQHAWLTHQQLLDAVAIGQFTPGPVLSTATFIGYMLAGAPGAVVATMAIFLPSFFYVALLAPVLFRLRQSAWMAAFLDAVNVCAVALMVGVMFRLGADALRGWPSWVIAVSGLAVLIRWRVNPAWVVLAGGFAGLVLAALR